MFFEAYTSLGKGLLLLSPEVQGTWNNTPVVTTAHPLWPVVLPDVAPLLLPSSLFDIDCMMAFNFSVNNLTVDNVTFITTCANDLCDGRYGTAVCPCTRHQTSVSIPAISFRWEENMAIQPLPYSSVRLARTLFVPSLLGVTVNLALDFNRLQLYLKNAFAHHVGGFRLTGWLKPGTRDGDDFVSYSKVHLTSVHVVGDPLPVYASYESDDDDGDAPQFESGLPPQIGKHCVLCITVCHYIYSVHRPSFIYCYCIVCTHFYFRSRISCCSPRCNR